MRLAALGQLLGLGVAGADAVRVLVTGERLTCNLPFSGPLAPGPLVLDPLAAVFVIALALVGCAVALYAPGYLARAHHRMSAPTQQALLLVLETAIIGVLCASDLIGFFICWEVMTALATALVLADGHDPEVKRAAILYIAITHIGTLAALAGLLILSSGASELSFDALRTAIGHASPATRSAGLALALLGFGTKAGVVPVHVWLPEAHPVAPSHVSALLSGVILKIGIYAMLRTCLDLAGPPDMLIGYTLIVVGMVSALVGVLYALVQHDLKRLLAFCSVENVGIILLGVGIAICAFNSGLPTIGALAMAGALLHVINHAVFKGLLFLCAGSVHLATHSRDLEQLGGLMRPMPSTGRAFLIGALAISALPPLNGFASEWLILQGCVGAAHAHGGLLRAAAPLLAAGLALAGALAAACFVKAFAVGFLALPRSRAAENATEAPRSLRLAQNLLALTCVILGLGALWAVAALSHVPASLGLGFPIIEPSWLLGGLGVASVSPLALAAGGLVVGSGLYLYLRRAPARSQMTWACGQGTVEGRAAYSASAFANPIRRIFSNLYRFERATEPVEGVPPYFVKRSRTRGALAPLFERYLYEPSLRFLHWCAAKLEPWVSPTVNRGLALFAATLALLLWWASS